MRTVHQHPATTLVVEDDPIGRVSLVRLLRSEGHDVDSAATLAEAMTKLDGTRKVVLLDLALPDGSGLEILNWIRSHDYPARIGVLTGSPDFEFDGPLEYLHPDALFIKPCHPAKILQWAAATRDALAAEDDEDVEP